MHYHGPFPPSKRGNTGFYNFVSKNGSQLIVSVKSTSGGLACLKMAHMKLSKPKYLRMDRQSNLLSTNLSIRTEFEAFNDSAGTVLKTTAPDTASQNGLAESAGRCAYEAATAAAMAAAVGSQCEKRNLRFVHEHKGIVFLAQLADFCFCGAVCSEGWPNAPSMGVGVCCLGVRCPSPPAQVGQ